MATRTFEGFSVSHAAILNGATGAEEALGDVYGVRDGSLDVDTDSYDNTGDEAVLSTWAWFNFATVSITAGFVPFDLLGLIAGDAVTSSGVASLGTDYYSVPLWSEGSLNVARRPLLIRVPSKDTLGVPRIFDFIMYSVQFDPFSFDGPTYKDGLVINYGGRALMSSVDEKGLALGERAIGRLVNKPG